MLINKLFSGKSLKARVLAYVTIFSLLAPSLLPIQAIAVAPERTCTLVKNTEVVVDLTATVGGTVSCTNYVGQASQYHVGIIWDDGSTLEEVAITDMVDADGNFSGNWSAEHTYGNDGVYDVTIDVYHVNTSGNDDGLQTQIVIPDILDYGENPPNEAPVITLIGDSPTSTPQNSVYADEGATANDSEDGALTPAVSSNNVNTAIVGAYEVVYTVTDSDSATAYATRTVNVIEAVEPPCEIDCAPEEPTFIKVHLLKYLDDELATVTANNYDFPMVSTWKTANLSGGATSSGNYVLGNFHGGAADEFAADTSPMQTPAYYSSHELTTNESENSLVLPADASCEVGKYRLVGYSSGDSLEEAEGGDITTATPEFYGLNADKYIIVWNETCVEDVPQGDGGFIQGLKYRDVNENNKFDEDKSPTSPDRLSDWSIGLYDENWNLLDQMLTGSTTSHDDDSYSDDSNLAVNQYRFNNLDAGTYFVCEESREGWNQITPRDGITDKRLQNAENVTTVEDPNNEGNYCYQVSLEDGQQQKFVRFGNLEEVQEFSISGYKFNDLNGNGNWGINNDPAEPGLGGWTISLAKKINGPISVSALGETSLTPILESAKNYFLNAFGTYDANDSITADARYSVRAPNTGWTDLVQNYEGYGPTLLDLQVDGDSPDWGNYNESHSYWLPVDGADAALALSIYDIAPENNAGNLDVDVYEIIATTTTNSDGSYSFNDLEVGDYIVRETNQLGWTQTFPEGDGTNYVSLTTEESTATNVNFGNTQEEVEEGEACGYKFHDLNANGAWDEGEPALEGIVMKLFEMNGEEIDQTRSATTDENGRFCFNIGNAPGDNILGEEEDNGWIASVGLPQEIDVEDTESSYTFEDVGNYRLSSITGSKWYDEDGDATWDEGENGIANWTISLTNLDTEEVVSTTTNESGAFSFVDLVPGNYQVTETMQEGYVQTYPINSEIDTDYHNISVISDSEIVNVWFGNDLNSNNEEEEEDDNGGGGGGGGSSGGCRPCAPCDNIRLNCDDNNGNGGGDDENGNQNPGNGGGGQGGTEGGQAGGNLGGQGGTEDGLALLTDGDAGDVLALGNDATTTASTTATTTDEDDDTNQLAAVGALGGLLGISWWWWILILILLGIIAYYTFRDKENN